MRFVINRLSVFSAAACLFAASGVYAEQDGPHLGGRIQAWAVGEQVDDEFRDSNRLFFFLKQGRLRVHGAKSGIKYNMQLGFAGSEAKVISRTGVSLNLLDFSADVPVTENSYIRIGQFKVPYGRERIADSGSLYFAERSLQRLAFNFDRDSGVSYNASHGDFHWALGIFTGGGRDVPERYLPEKLGVPLVALRLGLDTIGSDVNLIDPNSRKEGFSFFVNYAYTKDSLVGHSSVLNVDLDGKTLFTNSNWNPYIEKRNDKGELDQGELTHYGFDAAYQTGALFASLEYHAGKFKNTHGSIDLSATNLEFGYNMGDMDFALRYSSLTPDKNFAYSYTANSTTSTKTIVENSDAITEITPSFTYHLANRSAKFVFDLPYKMDVPVVTEPNYGSYVVTEQPDQVSNLSKDKASIERKSTMQARLLFQMSF